MDTDIDNPEFEQYQSIMSTIYSLIEADKQEKLDLVLRQNFPEYYSSPIPVILSEN